MNKEIPILLLLLSCVLTTAALADTWHADPVSGCTVFDSDDAATDVVVSWSGGCDGSSRATSDGVLSWFEDGSLAGRYVGPMLNGKANGSGVIYAAAEEGGFDRYAGVFKDNEVAGQLSAKSADGTTFNGVMNSADFSGRAFSRRQQVIATPANSRTA